jgi:S-adenosylmethionine synthetase
MMHNELYSDPDSFEYKLYQEYENRFKEVMECLDPLLREEVEQLRLEAAAGKTILAELRESISQLESKNIALGMYNQQLITDSRSHINQEYIKHLEEFQAAAFQVAIEDKMRIKELEDENKDLRAANKDLDDTLTCFYMESDS